MRRVLAIAIVLGAAIVVLGMPAAALAGGGCHGSMTGADATGQDEASVHLVDACFSASVTRVDPGTDVTFVHDDLGIIHNVGGTEWGFYGEMREGDAFTATFADPGVYPFACSYHPGMTGAIVVGDGNGAGSGWTVLNDPVAPAAEPTLRTVPTSAGSSTIGFAAVGVLGAGLGVAIALGIGRLRKTTPTA